MSNIWQNSAAIAQTQVIANSLKHWTGRNLLPGNSGTETDPVLNYGNAAALGLWEMTWAELTRTPSRLTAEAPNREERARLLATVAARGFIDDYSGIRISKTGRRFRIAQATVWNLRDDRGQPAGQAAMFTHWEFVRG
jgi:hypothetical protein